jgi:hypothetical protein
LYIESLTNKIYSATEEICNKFNKTANYCTNNLINLILYYCSDFETTNYLCSLVQNIQSTYKNIKTYGVFAYKSYKKGKLSEIINLIPGSKEFTNNQQFRRMFKNVQMKEKLK